MLRRLSTKVGFSKGRKEDTNNPPNGTTINTTVNGGTGLAAEKRSSGFGPLKAFRREETADHSGSREEVEDSFNQFAQLIHAARSPLPNQSGDGAYLDHAEPTGLMGDIKKLGFRDAKTLMEVMKTKASGEYQDDKTYIMERTIQVRVQQLLRIETETSFVASRSLTPLIKSAQGPHQCFH